jgi:hypothetical protein
MVEVEKAENAEEVGETDTSNTMASVPCGNTTEPDFQNTASIDNQKQILANEVVSITRKLVVRFVQLMFFCNTQATSIFV